MIGATYHLKLLGAVLVKEGDRYTHNAADDGNFFRTIAVCIYYILA